MILIDMKMPDCCYRCPACSYLSWWCDAMNKSLVHAISDETGRAEWCPIKELPPHGRLIDADALHQLFEAQWHYLQCLDWDENPTAEYTQSGVNWCINTMHDEAPTIIPAEEGE